jgi:hypothetical protein
MHSIPKTNPKMIVLFMIFPPCLNPQNFLRFIPAACTAPTEQKCLLKIRLAVCYSPPFPDAFADSNKATLSDRIFFSEKNRPGREVPQGNPVGERVRPSGPLCSVRSPHRHL